jgi:hypothetical protein
MYIEKLQLQRSERLAVLQTTYPAMHWRTLTLLGGSIIFAFLLVADQQVLLFLAPITIRLLFMVLVGSLVATACICVDLADPFGGAFQITPSSEQLYLIRDLVDQTLNQTPRDDEATLLNGAAATVTDAATDRRLAGTIDAGVISSGGSR